MARRANVSRAKHLGDVICHILMDILVLIGVRNQALSVSENIFLRDIT